MVHGCRQLVSWDVRLSPATSATLILSYYHLVEHSKETARVIGRKVGTTSNHHRLLRVGLHTCYNGRYKEKRSGDMEQTSKNRSQFGLKSATRLHEVGIASNRRSATLRWIRSRVLYTPPVKPWELVMPEVGL